MHVHKEIYYAGLAPWLEKLTGPKTCSWQAGDPGELMV